MWKGNVRSCKRLWKRHFSRRWAMGSSQAYSAYLQARLLKWLLSLVVMAGLFMCLGIVPSGRHAKNRLRRSRTQGPAVQHADPSMPRLRVDHVYSARAADPVLRAKGVP